MQSELFSIPKKQDTKHFLADNTCILPGFICDNATEIRDLLEDILLLSPPRYMNTPGGQRMSVALSSCGTLGWISDAKGYRYSSYDPDTHQPWPNMPPLFSSLAIKAAAEAGFRDFRPDACLINCYIPGSKMSLHQDKDEQDLTQPIVSVSLGLPAEFLWGGFIRGDAKQTLLLQHGDVLVWGGDDRLRFHGIKPLKPGWHPITGDCRINLTFRKAGG